MPFFFPDSSASLRTASDERYPAIEEALLHISLLVEEVPEITELDLNPIFALAPGEGCRIVDARIRVGQATDKQPARYAMAAAERT